MHAGQDDLFRPASQCRLDIENNVRHRTAAPFAACNGGNAERAVIITAILHLDEGARAAMQSGQRFTRNWFQIKRFLRGGSDTSATRWSLRSFVTTCQNVRQIQRLLRLEGCPAARRDNFIHTRPRHLTDLPARIRRGFVGHRAGIDDRHVRHLRRSDDLMPCQREIPAPSIRSRSGSACIQLYRGRFSYGFLSLRGVVRYATKQSPHLSGDCFGQKSTALAMTVFVTVVSPQNYRTTHPRRVLRRLLRPRRHLRWESQYPLQKRPL